MKIFSIMLKVVFLKSYCLSTRHGNRKLDMLKKVRVEVDSLVNCNAPSDKEWKNYQCTLFYSLNNIL